VIALAALPLLVSVILAVVGPRLGRALPGRWAAILLTCLATVTALSTGLVLGIVGFLVAAENPAVSAAEHWSAPVLDAAYPVPLAMGLAGAIVVMVLLSASFVRLAGLVRQLASAAATCRELGPAHGGLVVVDDVRPAAYALPGLSGRIVVTTAMLRALPADERRALLAHEAAHLRNHHYLYVQLSELAAAANPLLRPTAGAVRVAVERWADDVAVEHTGDRSLVARTLARAGLARSGAGMAGPYAALAVADTEVQQRIHSLLTPSTRRRKSAAAALVAMTVACTLSALLIVAGVHGIFEVAQAAYAQSR
jgi:Peptidase family M48